MTTTEQTLREALQRGLDGLSTATSFTSKKERDRHNETLYVMRKALALPPTPVQMPEAMTDEQIISIKQSAKCADPTMKWGDTLAFGHALLRQNNAMWTERLRAQPADLTPDALLRRIQASPFRDDKALADLVKGLQDLRRAAEQIYQVRSLDSADVPLEEAWPAEFEALGLALKATASASTTWNTTP